MSDATICSRRLYDLVRRQNWQSVIHRCFSHPHELTWQDNSGYSALHAALRRNPPLDVVVSLVSSLPVVVSFKTTTGETPLHIACSHEASPDVVQLLLNTHPDAVLSLDFDRSTPLHVACNTYPNGASKRIISSLLKIDPSPALQPNKQGLTPLSILGKRYCDMLQSGIAALDSAPNPSSAIVLHLGDCWDKMTLLLMAAYHGTINRPFPDNKKWRILHAAYGCKDCVSSFMILALKVHPEQVKERDEDGNLPIHIASKVLHEEGSSVIGALLDAFPDSATMEDGKGKLALELAIEGGKRWDSGISKIIEANPMALVKREMSAFLYSIILSKLGRDAELSTLFEVIRLKPDLLKYAGEGGGGTM